VITGNQLEVLVVLVLGLDAVVIAGIVISRLTQRRSNRQAASSLALGDAPYPGRPDGAGPAAETAAPAATAAFAEAPPSVGEAEYPAFAELAPPPVESNGSSLE
jgi:hypothetical protein